MPWVGGTFQQDGRSPLERLYGYQETMAKMQALKQQQDLMRERQKILAESMTPGKAGDMSVSFEQAQQPQQSMQGFFSQALTGGAPASIIGAQSPEQVNLQMTEATPAKFDAESAVARLYGAGDLAGAQSIVNDQYKDSMAARTTAAGEKWYGNGKTIKGADGKLYNQLTSSAGNTKLVPIEGDIASELKRDDLGGRVVWRNPMTGEVVIDQAVTATPYQAFQMDTDAQAGQAGAVKEATVKAEAKAARESAKEEKADDAGAAITELNSLVGSLEALPQSVLGMQFEGLNAYFTGGDPKIQQALGNIDRISGKMLKYAERLPGAASESDKVDFKASAGVMSDPKATPARKIAAAQSAISSYQRMIEADRRAKAGGQSAPAPSAPKPAQRPSIPPQAIEMLRKNPGLAKQFDQKYGSGAAARVLR